MTFATAPEQIQPRLSPREAVVRVMAITAASWWPHRVAAHVQSHAQSPRLFLNERVATTLAPVFRSSKLQRPPHEDPLVHPHAR